MGHPPGFQLFCSSHFSRRVGALARVTQNHFFHRPGAPYFDMALQRSQLRLACVSVRNRRRQLAHQFMGCNSGLGDQPPFNDRPHVGERIHLGLPPALCLGLLSVHRTCFPFLRRRGEARAEDGNIWFASRRCFSAYAVGRDEVTVGLACKPVFSAASAHARHVGLSP